jgi:hypothetical protein
MAAQRGGQPALARAAGGAQHHDAAGAHGCASITEITIKIIASFEGVIRAIGLFFI